MSHTERSPVNPHGVALKCALIALAVASLAVSTFLRPADWDVTTLIRMSPADPLAAIAQEIEGNVEYVPQGHYDGVYYYAIAIDPLATGEASDLIDLPAHRYGHPGYGWLTWVASLGNPDWVPQMLLVVGLATFAIAGYFGSRLAALLGLSPWGGLAVALNPGLVFAVTTDNSEAATAALLGVALFLWLRDRWVLGGVLLGLVCFFKFQMTLVPVALAGWELLRYVRERSDLVRVKKRIALLAAGPLLFLVWVLYLGQRFEKLPTAGAPDFLSFPFVGFLSTLRDLAPIGQMNFDQVQAASAQVPILACILVLFVIAIARAARLRHPIDAVFLLQGLFVLLLNWWNLFYPKDMLRSLSIPFSLLVAVLALRDSGRLDEPHVRNET